MLCWSEVRSSLRGRSTASSRHRCEEASSPTILRLEPVTIFRRWIFNERENTEYLVSTSVIADILKQEWSTVLPTVFYFRLHEMAWVLQRSVRGERSVAVRHQHRLLDLGFHQWLHRCLKNTESALRVQVKTPFLPFLNNIMLVPSYCPQWRQGRRSLSGRPDGAFGDWQQSRSNVYLSNCSRVPKQKVWRSILLRKQQPANQIRQRCIPW